MRAVAKKVFINDLSKGEFVRGEKEYEPSYVDIGEKRISRVHIIGKVEDIIDNEKGKYIIVEDDTGNISTRWYDITPDVNVGEYIEVIGKIRETEEGRYIVGEICKKRNEKWKELRELEIKLLGERYGI